MYDWGENEASFIMPTRPVSLGTLLRQALRCAQASLRSAHQDERRARHAGLLQAEMVVATRHAPLPALSGQAQEWSWSRSPLFRGSMATYGCN